MENDVGLVFVGKVLAHSVKQTANMCNTLRSKKEASVAFRRKHETTYITKQEVAWNPNPKYHPLGKMSRI